MVKEDDIVASFYQLQLLCRCLRNQPLLSAAVVYGCSSWGMEGQDANKESEKMGVSCS